MVTVAGAINRETDGPTRSITVRATSADGSFTDQAYTITINDVDEFDVGAVSDTDATTNAITRTQRSGQRLALLPRHPMLTQQPTHHLSLVSSDGGRFTINSSTGVVTVAGAINRETDGPTRSITVRATSADGSFTDQAYTITINDVDEFDVGSVSDTDATTNAVNENAAIGTTVGITASASDADATTNGITYSLANDDSGRFTINSSTGVVQSRVPLTVKPTGRLAASLFVLPLPMDRSPTRLTQSRSTMSMSSMSVQQVIRTRLPTQ